MSTTEIFLIALVIIFSVPYLVWRLAGPTTTPLVVVQIITGILLGPGVLGLSSSTTTISRPGGPGTERDRLRAVMVFVWIAGIELDLRAARKHRREPALPPASGMPLLLAAPGRWSSLATGGWAGPRGCGSSRWASGCRAPSPRPI
jgi:Kef-type K+ transport system membrane component KefB